MWASGSHIEKYELVLSETDLILWWQSMLLKILCKYIVYSSETFIIQKFKSIL